MLERQGLTWTLKDSRARRSRVGLTARAINAIKAGGLASALSD
jgi:hypothetical protein